MNAKSACPAILFVLFLCGVLMGNSVRADDTDIYKPKVQHNVMILLDNSGSMGFGVYENAVDYHDFYRYIAENKGDWTMTAEWDPALPGYRYDTDVPYYDFANKKTRDRIYLVAANAGYSDSSGMTGDPGNPSLNWKIASAIDTGTTISGNGSLSGGNVTVGADGTILYDGSELPNQRSIKLHDWQQNYDGSVVDNGFAGLVGAPGFYFSGYFDDGSAVANDNPAAADTDASGKAYVYFFATGNFLNMQMVYNLWVYDGKNWIADAWDYCTYPKAYYLPSVPYSLASPNYPDNYPHNYDSVNEGSVSNVIYNGQSEKIRLYFSELVLGAGDTLTLRDENSNLVATYTGPYSDTDGLWTTWATGRQITVRFQSDDDSDTVAKGWNIASYQYQSKTDFNMASRLEISQEAIIEVIEATRGKINWGVSVFDQKDNSGSVELAPLNASFNDDQDKQNLINHLESAVASGGTPLGESLQDIYDYFTGKVNQVHRDCNKNFVITLTDGFPSNDTEWNRISGVDFTNADYHDSIQFTSDPFQYPTPPDNYYDDVAYFMFSHSYVDGSVVALDDRRDSADNITVHNIGFCLDQPMLQHTADIQVDQYGVPIGMYLTAYSKAQVMNAFHSIGLAIAEYTSYTAPVVSVDETNRVQSGDRLYMALFKPKENEQWTGNLKKYGLKYGFKGNCGRNEEWYVADGSIDSATGSWIGQEATDCDGFMLPNTSSFWSTQNDGGDVERGGAGQVLYNLIPPPGTTLSTPPTFRRIFSYLGGLDVQLTTGSITNTDLGVATDEERYKIINFLYGYTYDTKPDGSPVYKRSWPLGSIIHSTPKLIDYTDSNKQLIHRYIAVGANDGMLHVFDDANGKEIFAFVPPEVLTRLKNHDPALGNDKVYSVDGPVTLVRDSSDDFLLIFGLRRGGRAYYALNVTDTDPSNWKLKWAINPSTTGMGELGQTWGQPEAFTIKVGKTTDGKFLYKRLLLIPGGYDAGEDRPDINDYYLDKTHTSAMGRGILIVDVDTGQLLADTYFSNGSQFIYDASDTGLKKELKYCFPADPTVLLAPDGTLLGAYLTDLYGQVWKVSYDASTLPGKFSLNLIFQTNPMTDQASAYENRTAFSSYDSGDSDPRGTIDFVIGNKDTTWVLNPRKTFYSPDVGWAGNCYTDVPVLYMGTGDRENPTFTGSANNYVENGLYGFYDAHAYYTIQEKQTTYDDLTQRFTEKDLLNVTCGALEPDVINVDDDLKGRIYTFLEEGARGWYMLFDADSLSGCPSPDQDVSHAGEKAISPITLFNGVVYAPTYQPAAPAANNDPCDYDGQARVYAVNYCDGNAVYNFYSGNDSFVTKADGTTETTAAFTRRDRYLGIGKQIPSGLAIVIRHGKAEGFISVDGKIVTLEDLSFPSGLIPYYWQDTRKIVN